MPQARQGQKALFEGSEWTFKGIHTMMEAIEEIALHDLGLVVYPNQIEIITSEQMLDVHCSNGLPLMYQHWSFGKHFILEEFKYRKGYRGLAYEIVINSNPCISYLMEENSMAMQTLVLAHAAFGHNHFFRNNYLFEQWTDAEGILDYLAFAKQYIADCEERHGAQAVEEIIDAAHALMDQGVFRHSRHPALSEEMLEARERSRREYDEQHYNDLWRTLPQTTTPEDESLEEKEIKERMRKLNLPEENLLYFIEKNAPNLEIWEREILRIIRIISQYFYPQKQTKVMNEGCACFVHRYVAEELHKKGLLTDRAYLEILHSHTNVTFQPGFDHPGYSGINPYALGYAMMQDIVRIVTDPTEEDYEWFPEIAGTQDWRRVLKDAWANYRDDSFILQYLSPRLMRDFRLFCLHDSDVEDFFEVTAIHDERGYKELRTAFAKKYNISSIEPDIQVVDVDLKGDRRLVLHHTVHDDIPLDEETQEQVLAHLHRLWGYPVTLLGIDGMTGDVLSEMSSDDFEEAA